MSSSARSTVRDGIPTAQAISAPLVPVDWEARDSKMSFLSLGTQSNATLRKWAWAALGLTPITFIPAYNPANWRVIRAGAS